MKYLTLLTILLLSITAFAQPKTLEQIKKQNEEFNRKTKCEISYDKFKDITFIATKPSYVASILGIQAAFSFKGQTFDNPVKHYSVFIYTGSLMKDTSLIFIVNNERIKIGEAVESNDSTTDFIGTKVYRHQFVFSPEQFEKLASSEGIEFQIGNLDGKTSKQTFEKLNNLKQLSTLK